MKMPEKKCGMSHNKALGKLFPDVVAVQENPAAFVPDKFPQEINCVGQFWLFSAGMFLCFLSFLQGSSTCNTKQQPATMKLDNQ